MSRKISLNLELNKRLSRASNYTPCSDRSSDHVNGNSSSKPSIYSQENLLKESILKTRETIRSRIESRKNECNAGQGNLKLNTGLGSPRFSDLRSPRTRVSNLKLQLMKYSAFVTKKMQEHELLNALFIDRVPQRTRLIEMIEKNEFESALLLTLQLISDMVVHCEEYLPNITPASDSLYTEGECTTTNESNNLPQ